MPTNLPASERAAERGSAEEGEMKTLTNFSRPTKLRHVPESGSTPITEATYDRLLIALESVYPGKWRRSVDVCPVAVNKTIDNEADALETIRRIKERK